MKNDSNFKHGTQLKTGILLLNLGTPDSATPAGIRVYLRQFLSDTRVVEIPKIIWWFILNCIILVVRPKKTAKKYASVWMPEGSPLRVYTERQTQLLRGYLGAKISAPIKIEFAMRYGNPSMESAIHAMCDAGCENILLLPLYPQYAASTTASTMDELGRVMRNIRNVPGVRLVRSFHDHPAYINAVVKNVQASWMKNGPLNFVTDKLLMTFHGLPKVHLTNGDPYHCQCHKTARLIAEGLGIKKDDYVVTFQSRFGAQEWLQPYTDKTLESLGKSGVARIDVICPGFAADCLETLEEIADEGRETFLHAGGKAFNYVPVCNDSEPFIHALAAVATQHLQGLIPLESPTDAWDSKAANLALGASANLARALGAPQ